MSDDRATIIVGQYRSAAESAGIVDSNSYKGLRIHAAPGLHDFIAQKAVEFFSPGSSILDLAAGSGALTLRMKDLGFQVCATDYVQENFRLIGSTPFVQADLNGNFSSNYTQKFDAIIATEIIEHLENPRNFSRECFKLLKVGGKMLLTTPNLESTASKVLFLRSGNFAWFSDKDYEYDGHITPLTQWQIQKVFLECGFRFVWSGSFGDSMRLLQGSPRLRILGKILNLLSLKGHADRGENFATIIEKPPTQHQQL